MKKIINNRPLFFIFVAFGFGIFFARPIFSFNWWIISFSIIVLASVGFLCFKFKLYKRFVIILLAFIIGVSTFLLASHNFSGKTYGSGLHEIVGRICATTTYYDSESLIIDSVIVDGTKTDEKFKVFVYNETNLEIGDVILFNAKITGTKLYDLGKFNSYYYKNNIKQECSVNIVDVINVNNLNFAEKVRGRVKTLLNKNMSEEEASVCYASLFGDKTYIPSEIKEVFSVSGMAHMLAVSGLHIGFLVVAISMLLSKIKSKKWVKIAILSSILLVYCYFCSFAPSVVRATIMFFILSLSRLIGQKYDRLNSWSLAGIIILAISPLYVFDAGFQLSFVCVLSIIMFFSYFEKLFLKMHLPKQLASSLAISVPVTFGIIPIMCQHFSKISLLSIFANLVAVPLFELFFILLFATTIVCLILPFLNFVMRVPMLLIHIIIWLAGLVSSLKFAIVQLTKFSSVLVLCIYVLLFTCSHFVNLAKRLKLIISCFILTIGALLSLVMASPIKVGSNKISIINSYGKNVYAIEIEGNEFVVGRFNKYLNEKYEQYLISNNIYNTDYYVSLTNVIPENVGYYKNICTCKETNGALYLHGEERYNFNGVIVEAIYLNNKFAGILFTAKSITIFVCNDASFNEGLCMDFSNMYANINLLIGSENYTKQFAKYLNCFVLNDGTEIQKSDKIIANSTGSWTFVLKDDMIKRIRSLD